MLFADDAVTTTAAFPPYFWVMLAALIVVSVVAMGLFGIFYWVIDWITPGNFSDELLGRATKNTKDPLAVATRPPNQALAILAGAMMLGMSVIIGCTVIGVLIH